MKDIIMTPEDYFVAGKCMDTPTDLLVFSRFLSYNKSWPETLEHKETTYKFDGKEVMPKEYANDYFSMARYIPLVKDV